MFSHTGHLTSLTSLLLFSTSHDGAILWPQQSGCQMPSLGHLEWHWQPAPKSIKLYLLACKCWVFASPGVLLYCPPHFKNLRVIQIGTSVLQMESERDTTQEGWQSAEWWSVREWEEAGRGGMMSLWVILLTGNHAVMIVANGFSWEQERARTWLWVKGQQLACAGVLINYSAEEWGCVVACFSACKHLRQFKVGLKNETWLFDQRINRTALFVAGTDVSTLLRTNILKS